MEMPYTEEERQDRETEFYREIGSLIEDGQIDPRDPRMSILYVGKDFYAPAIRFTQGGQPLLAPQRIEPFELREVLDITALLRKEDIGFVVTANLHVYEKLARLVGPKESRLLTKNTIKLKLEPKLRTFKEGQKEKRVLEVLYLLPQTS